MKKLSLQKITAHDSPALTSYIDYWKGYDANTVLLSYAELKRRNHRFSEKNINRLKEFCAKHNYADIDSLLSSSLKTIGYNSYAECYLKEIVAEKEAKTEQAVKIEIGSSINEDEETKYPALRSISIIIKIFGWFVFIGTAIFTYVLAENDEISAYTLFISGIIMGLGAIAFAELIKLFIDIEHNTRTITNRK